MANDCIITDVLVIGSGISGSTTALKLSEAELNVVLISRAENICETNTYYAQGGIIYKGENDSRKLLENDILNAGDHHCNPKAVKILASEGPELVEKFLIDHLDIQFDTQNGKLSLVAEGGHSVPRIIHTTDATGKAIQNALCKAISRQANIQILKSHTVIDLLAPHHHSIDRLQVYQHRSCVGAYVLDQKNMTVKRIIARKTILASGGLGQIFLRTTNPAGARGDGLAMANRMGARVLNNQFIQFHPTTFFHSQAPHFLISEAVRGEGARLVDRQGNTFMHKYDPKWQDLAPRDIVSRSIHQEMLDQGVDHVYLDLVSYISVRKIRQHFPNIYKQCLEYGIDITTQLVPVVPAAHYACGGVWVDEWGLSTISNLYAVGEVSCTGVHGANRLASTSLLEGLVWANRAAHHICRQTSRQKLHNPDDIPPWEDIGKFEPDPALISQDMSYIKHIMWNYVGLIRNRWRLERAMRELRNLESEIERFYRRSRVTDSLIGLRNAVRSAIIITSAAWENKKSMGCHYRED
ncbi:MAG: L-aspartate oxidase [Calditrichaceae bacterium]|nr:L-aspartate oxidase [Calditrichaceae bacterium]RQV97839.1 MAG: L-aspartate oxidase [Calditrichota bacterium]